MTSAVFAHADIPARLLEEHAKALGGQQEQHHDQPMVPEFTITFPVLWLLKQL